jgi:hypothetical protein
LNVEYYLTEIFGVATPSVPHYEKQGTYALNVIRQKTYEIKDYTGFIDFETIFLEKIINFIVSS